MCQRQQDHTHTPQQSRQSQASQLHQHLLMVTQCCKGTGASIAPSCTKPEPSGVTWLRHCQNFLLLVLMLCTSNVLACLQPSPSTTVVIPFLTHFADLTSWEYAQKLTQKVLPKLRQEGVQVGAVHVLASGKHAACAERSRASTSTCCSFTYLCTYGFIV